VLAVSTVVVPDDSAGSPSVVVMQLAPQRHVRVIPSRGVWAPHPVSFSRAPSSSLSLSRARALSPPSQTLKLPLPMVHCACALSARRAPGVHTIAEDRPRSAGQAGNTHDESHAHSSGVSGARVFSSTLPGDQEHYFGLFGYEITLPGVPGVTGAPGTVGIRLVMATVCDKYSERCTAVQGRVGAALGRNAEEEGTGTRIHTSARRATKTTTSNHGWGCWWRPRPGDSRAKRPSTRPVRRRRRWWLWPSAASFWAGPWRVWWPTLLLESLIKIRASSRRTPCHCHVTTRSDRRVLDRGTRQALEAPDVLACV
jgi:hypothetical protein